MINVLQYSNTISIDVGSGHDTLVKDAVAMVKKSIKAYKPGTLTQTQNTIFYRAGMLRLVWSVNLLFGISEGEITVEKKADVVEVFYVIKFYELFVLSFFAALWAVVILNGVALKIIGLLFIMLGLYGVPVLVTVLRYKNFIKTIVKHLLLGKHSVVIDEEQKKWINDIDTCDACGHRVSPTDAQCPECGLRLR